MKPERRWLALVPLLIAFVAPGMAGAPPDVVALAERLDQEWAEIFYDANEAGKARRLIDLLARAEAFKAANPTWAEPRIVTAVTLCSLAGVDWGLDSLSRIDQARQLLTQAVDLDPKAMEGAAYIALGNLYWRMPGWPISFGDDARARQYLTNAVNLFPAAIDANFFMADFLIDQGEYPQAHTFLERAERAPIRASARTSDTRLKEEMVEARRVITEKGRSRPGFFSRLLPDFGSS